MIAESCEDLYRKDSLKRLLRRFDIRADRNRGQHFLVDRKFLETVAGGAGTGEVALEIGAGPGSLTCLLKERFDRVLAVEIDESFGSLFAELNPEKSVELIQADFLNLDFTKLGLGQPGAARLVGNIPYNITGKILERAVAERRYFSKAVFTIQKEVADRILADPGTKGCGAITYYIQAYAEVSRLAALPPDAFYPPPEVDSSIIEICFTREKKFETDDESFFSVVRGLFNYRRKTIRKGLIVSPEFSLEKVEVDDLLDQAKIDPRKRPEELTIKDFDKLTAFLNNRGRG
ncbi:16S rRNA (adenine(1518)-N(6)/adenine(1519)-N(6))-dimethyltransferase RsmA [Candidatus Bipolaricaulota bacterium]|nr:16S rRNA (adenine(1518)-N(6)/adenine(1519)-N(6))-dimethyltransferase RsmA [Candidatus Bipolaricaulota bacterium]